MIDSHCHIGFDGDDLPLILEHAQSVGITRMLSVACEPKDYNVLLSVLQTYPQIDGAMGLHPEYAADWEKVQPVLTNMFAQTRLVAVGECGLDYHYAPDSRDAQCKVFESHIELAYALKKPLIIHTRDAEEDTLSILESAHRARLLSYGAVLHCFTGSAHLAERAIQMGIYISASGVITFKSAEDLRRLFQQIPLERLLIETDSPYLSPIPYRGQKNEPAFIQKTAEKLSELKGISVFEIDQITTQNYNTLFLKGRDTYAG